MHLRLRTSDFWMTFDINFFPKVNRVRWPCYCVPRWFDLSDLNFSTFFSPLNIRHAILPDQIYCQFVSEPVQDTKDVWSSNSRFSWSSNTSFKDWLAGSICHSTQKYLRKFTPNDRHGHSQHNFSVLFSNTNLSWLELVKMTLDRGFKAPDTTEAKPMSTSHGKEWTN